MSNSEQNIKSRNFTLASHLCSQKINSPTDKANCSYLGQKSPKIISPTSSVNWNPFQERQRRTRLLPRAEHYRIRGYLTLCCISALVALLSILMLHAMSSIWLDPVRNLKLNQEFVYITVALATVSAALNFYALAAFGIQIYLVYTNDGQDETRMFLYLQKVATVRFVASLSVFMSIPIFLTSFGCYMYMEFRRIAALIAISILAFSSFCMIAAVSYSYYKWNELNCKETSNAKERNEIIETPVDENSFALSNTNFKIEGNSTPVEQNTQTTCREKAQQIANENHHKKPKTLPRKLKFNVNNKDEDFSEVNSSMSTLV